MEGHHEAEQTHGLGQSEAENSVREQLLLQAGVPRVSDDERSEDGSNSSSGSSHSNSGGSSSDELCGGVNVSVVGGGGERAGLHGHARLGSHPRHLNHPAPTAVSQCNSVHGEKMRRIISCRSESSNISL